MFLVCYVQNAVNVVEHIISPRFLSLFPAVFKTDLTMPNGYILRANWEKLGLILIKRDKTKRNYK